jgi:hypothetical protein
MTEPKTPASLADRAAESIRSLNHATLSRRDGWEYPADAYDVVGDLARLVMMLPQALEQTGKFFDDLADNGHVGVDAAGRERGTTAPVMQAHVAASLINAVALAKELCEELNDAHAALSHATYTNG